MMSRKKLLVFFSNRILSIELYPNMNRNTSNSWDPGILNSTVVSTWHVLLVPDAIAAPPFGRAPLTHEGGTEKLKVPLYKE